jgi:hypothetical protein
MRKKPKMDDGDKSLQQHGGGFLKEAIGRVVSVDDIIHDSSDEEVINDSDVENPPADDHQQQGATGSKN